MNKVISKRAIRWEWADPKRGVKHFKKVRNFFFRKEREQGSSSSRKGNRLKFRCWIRESEAICSFYMGFVCGNAKELQDRRKKRQQRCLFCLKKWKGRFLDFFERKKQGKRLLNELLIRIILGSFSFLLKRRNAFFLLPAFFVLHENWRDSVSFQSSRSTNRSRCSRLIASSFGHNVCKGSRQNGSVTLEERVALEVEEVGWYAGVIFVVYGLEKPLFSQGSRGGSTVHVDFGRHVRECQKWHSFSPSN